MQADELQARIAVHSAGRGISLDHETRCAIVEDQPIAGSCEDALIRPFLGFTLQVALLA